MRPALVADGVHAPADPLGHPPVAGGGAQGLVPLDDLLADGDHLLGLEADVDPEVAQRAIEPLDVLLQAEDAPLEGARHVEAAVAAVEAAIAVGDDDLRLGDEPAVEVGGAEPHGYGPGRGHARLLTNWPIASTAVCASSSSSTSSLPTWISSGGRPRRSAKSGEASGVRGGVAPR